MRVLHVGKFYPPFAGGMEDFLADLVRAQLALGLEVAALVYGEGPDWRGSVPAAADPPPRIYRTPAWAGSSMSPSAPFFPGG